METVNGGSLGEDKGGPPPPSPLTGCYLLVVIGEPHSKVHKDIILQKVAKGLLSWNVNDCLVDLEKELAIITEQGLEGEEARYGERLIQFASENLVTEILIHPAVSTLSQCVRNLLSSFTRHRHIIHAGYTFQGNGSWALQDGTFSCSDFAEAFQEIEVQRVIHAYENGISIDLHCAPEGDWTRLPKEFFTKFAKVRVNPTDVLTTGSPSITSFTKYLEPFLVPSVLEDILESSDVVGNIRFSRPTLYVFPGGQGDAALFGINGFNMLLDGGYSRKACFWDFVRHLDRLDAVLMTRLNNSSLSGVSSVLKRKKQGAIYPQLGHFFCNIQERKSLLSPDGDKDKDPLIISLFEEGQSIIQDLHHLNLSPQTCYRDSEPIILYHKVGHGTLNMFVLSPDKNSRDVREFLQKWHQSDSKLFASAKTGKEFTFPLQNLVSICALLVWQPANPNDTITRILYPGSTPQKKIFDGLDRLKSLECMKHPVCTVKSVMPVKKTKQDILDKLVAKESKAPSEKKIENKVLIETSIKSNGEMNGDVINKDKPIKKSDSLETDKDKKPKKAEESKVIENGEKTKARVAKIKPRAESQPRKKPIAEKKGPPTPKKSIENKTNGETKAAFKPSPNATPAKSTKDANNRKVIESKKAPVKKEPVPKAAPVEAKPKPERKPISRRPKAIKGPPSPMKKMSNGIQKPDSLSKRGKLDKEGTTDSSTVSTPSADQESILKKDISKLTPEEFEQLKEKELEELKEEQEAVKEIEAVFRKGETRTEASEPGVRKIKEISIDDNLDTEEYLIIEKEEVEHDSLDQNEDEMQKLVRDSEESEKQRKSSGEEEKLKIEAQEHKIVEVEEPTKTPEELDAKKTEADKKELTEEENKEIVESHPEEKVSANIESGATTTAPTLPEDERMTLDEIKEDNGQVVEEKHVKEETKEKEIPIIQLPPKSLHDSQSKPHPVVGISLDKQKHVRDIVKTPDEVADLPVHEEADYQEFQDDKKSNEVADKEGEKKEEKETDDVEDKGKLDEAKKETEKKTETDNVEAVAKPAKEATNESEVAEKQAEVKEEKGIVVEAEVEESKKVPEVYKQDEKSTDLVKKDLEAPKDVAKEIPIESTQLEIDSKLNDSVISSSQKTEEIEKSDILEKADIESNEDAVIVQEAKLKESMDEEWVVISKEEEEEEIAEEADKVLQQLTEPTKKDTVVSDFISKEVEHQELTQSQAGAKPDLSLPLVPAADFKSEKEIDTATTESSSHEIRKGDEVENVSSDKEKDDIQALIEEADKKPMQDTIVEKQDEEKIHEMKETEHEFAEIDTKLQDLKKEVTVPIEEIKLDKDVKDLDDKIEEPGQPGIKQKLDDIAKIDDKLTELKGKTELETFTNGIDHAESTISEKAKIVEKSTKSPDHAEQAMIEKAEVLVKKSTRSPEHAESVVLPDSSPEDDGPLVLKALDIDKLELGRKSPAEREDDVQLIVASVAEVLKSEAPLEEFANKLPFTQELRETHITTQDSPILESKIIKAEDIIPSIPEEPHEEEMNGVKEDDESGTVHRMLVTTSSEDGGEEIEICPAGTITFSKSSESSGRSSPEPSQKTQSQKSSIVETLSDTLSTVKQVADIDGKVDASSVVHEAFQVAEELEEKVDNLKDEIEKSEARNVDDKDDKIDEKLVEEKLIKKVEHDVEVVKREEIESADVAAVDAKFQEKIKEVKFIEDVKKGAEIDNEKVEAPKLEKKDDTEAKNKAEFDEDAEKVPKVSIGESAEEPKDKAIPVSPEKEMVTEEDKVAKHAEPCETPTENDVLAKPTAKEDIQQKEISSKLKEEVAEKDTKEASKDVTVETISMPKEAATKDVEGEKQVEKLIEAAKGDTLSKSPDKNLEEIHDTRKKESHDSDEIAKTVAHLENDVKDVHQEIIDESKKAKEGTKKASDVTAEAETEVSDKISGIFEKIEQHVETAAAAVESSVKTLDDSLPETNNQSKHEDDSEDVVVPTRQRRQSIIEKTQDFIEKSEEAFEGVLSYISTKAHSVLDDIIKSDTDSNKLSGQSTPESKELKDSTKLSSPYLSDVDTSRKSTPDLKESSGKSTPEPKQIVTEAVKPDSQQLSQEVSPALSRKSTPEPKEQKELVPDTKRDSIDSRKSSEVGLIDASPIRSGKSTPDLKVDDSRKSSIDSKAADKAMSPEPKDTSHAVIDSDKSKDDHIDASPAVSRKSTPEPKIEDLKKDSVSGKSTPEQKIATNETKDTISDSRKLSVDHKQTSGKSTPELKEAKDVAEEAKKDTTDDSKTLSAECRVDSSPALSGKSTPEPKEVIVDTKKDTKDLEDKKDVVEDAKKDTKDLVSDSTILSRENHIDSPSALSGKSTPEPKTVVANILKDSKDSVEPQDTKSLVEDAKKDVKDAKQDVEDSKVLSAEDHIDASPALSGKSTPELKEVVADAKKDSKESVEPKTTFEEEKKDAKDLITDSKILSVDGHIDASPALSGKSTPELKDGIADARKDSKESVELKTSLEEDKKDGKDSITDSKILSVEGHIDAFPALSGKSTPELKEVVADAKKESKESVELKTTFEEENKDAKDLITDSKISVEGHIDASPALSGKSTLELKEAVADAKKDSKEFVELKNTFEDERKDTKDLITSPALSGNSTNGSVLSEISSPKPKEVVAGIKKDSKDTLEDVKHDSKDLISDSKILPEECHTVLSSALSGKSTPESKDVLADTTKDSEDTAEGAKKDTKYSISDSKTLSKEGHIDASPALSGKSTPESKEVVADAKKDSKDTVEDVKHDSKDLISDSKILPEGGHTDLSSALSGKSTPESKDGLADTPKHSKETAEDAKKDTKDLTSDSKTLSGEGQIAASPALSGKSTPEPKEVVADARKYSKDTVEDVKHDSKDLISDSKILNEGGHTVLSSALSGKSTPESKDVLADTSKDSKDTAEDAKKDTKDLISDSKTLSEEGHIAASPALSGKSTPEPKEVVADAKKDSKDTVEDVKHDSKDLISDSKLLPEGGHTDLSSALSGKSTPESKDVSADTTKYSKDTAEDAKKDTKDLISDSKTLSGEGHIAASPALSGKTTPEPKELVADTIKDSKASVEIKDAVEDLKNDFNDLKSDINISTAVHIDASSVLSGKSTPEPKQVIADSKDSVELKDTKDVVEEAKKETKDVISVEGQIDASPASILTSSPELKLVHADTKPDTEDSVDSKKLLESTPEHKESKVIEESHIDSPSSGKTIPVMDSIESKKLAEVDQIEALSRKSSEALDIKKEALIEASALSEQSPALSGKSTPEHKKLSGQSSPSPSHDHIDTSPAKSSKSTLEHKDLDTEPKKDDEVKAAKEERRESIIEAAEEFLEKSEKALGSMFSAIGGAAKSVLDDIWADNNKEKEDKTSVGIDKVKEALEPELVKEKSELPEKTEQKLDQLSKSVEIASEDIKDSTEKVEIKPVLETIDKLTASRLIPSEESVDASKEIEKKKISEKDQLQHEVKVDKDAAETEKKQTLSEEFEVTKETIIKEEKEIEDKVMHLSETFEKVSELAQSIPFETCESIKDEVEKKVIEKEEKQIEKQAEKLDGIFDDLSKLNESVTFEKCHPPEEYHVDKETVSRVDKKIEDQATHLSDTAEEVSELAKSISFEKCHQKSDSVSEKMDQPKSDEGYQLDEAKVDKDVAEKEKSPTPAVQMKNDESKVAKDILEKEATPSFEISKEAMEKDEKIIDDQVKHVSETADSLSNLARAASFEKCKTPEEFKVNKDVIEKQEKKIDAEVSQIKDNVDDLDKLTKSVSFDKCKLKDDIKEHKEAVDEKADKSPDVEAKAEEIVDSNKVEHLKQDKESSSKLESDACKHTISKSEQIPQAKESIVLDDQPISSQTEKCEKESMEKTSSSLKITQEPKKLSISDVEISIKTDIECKDATRSFLDNERAVFCDSTDAKVYIAPKEVDSSIIEASSDKSSPEIELSGKATPPTQPVSPVVTKDIQKSPSSKLDSGLSEQTETDEEDLSTKSQIAHSQSDLDELDMKMDPMSMSFYGALPEEHEGEAVAPTYLYEITKAKYGADVKIEEDSKDDDGMSRLMTASFIGDLPSSSTVVDKSKKDAVDSWGKPLGLPAPTYLYEVTKAKFSSQSHEADLMTSSFIGELPTSTQDPMTASVYFGGEVSDESFDPIASWGKPLGLPSPAPPNNGTPKKEKKLTAYVSAKNKLNEKRAESPSKLKAKKVNPVYVDLTYVPHHGNHYYSYVDFFKRIRARYYVFSGLEPSRQVYDALLEAKQTWDEKELEVTIIPTYDTDILGYWVAENEELLSKFKIDLAPSASRCTINLQDHETSCSAYRLEF